jgi:hypothetical protein
LSHRVTRKLHRRLSWTFGDVEYSSRSQQRASSQTDPEATRNCSTEGPRISQLVFKSLVNGVVSRLDGKLWCHLGEVVIENDSGYIFATVDNLRHLNASKFSVYFRIGHWYWKFKLLKLSFWSTVRAMSLPSCVYNTEKKTGCGAWQGNISTDSERAVWNQAR